MGDVSAHVKLPPGFKFSPTDEELVLHFLYRKASLLPCYPDIIPDLDLYPLDPWQLDGKALSSGKEWYFFCRQTMENQVTESGVWKQLDVEEPILVSDTCKKVGIKKYLVFYMGQSPATVETNWMMQEYHLCSNCIMNRLNGSTCKRNKKSDLHKWVLCRAYQREGSNSCRGFGYKEDEYEGSDTELSCLDEIYLALEDDDLDDISFPN